MLYFPPHDYFVTTTNLYILVPSPFSPIPPTTLPSGNDHNVLCIYKSVSVLFVHIPCFLDSTFKWNHVAFVFFCLTDFTQNNTL